MADPVVRSFLASMANLAAEDVSAFSTSKLVVQVATANETLTQMEAVISDLEGEPDHAELVAMRRVLATFFEECATELNARVPVPK